MEFKHKAGFLTVYITEAHTQDEWPMGDDVLLEHQPTKVLFYFILLVLYYFISFIWEG
jgi:Iodothyronine deiodinase